MPRILRALARHRDKYHIYIYFYHTSQYHNLFHGFCSVTLQRLHPLFSVAFPCDLVQKNGSPGWAPRAALPSSTQREWAARESACPSSSRWGRRQSAAPRRWGDELLGAVCPSERPLGQAERGLGPCCVDSLSLLRPEHSARQPQETHFFFKDMWDIPQDRLKNKPINIKGLDIIQNMFCDDSGITLATTIKSAWKADNEHY